MDAHTV